MSDTPTMGELLDRHADKDAYDAANAYPTLYRGTYRLQATAWEMKALGEMSEWPGKEVIHLTLRATNETRKGVLFTNITPETLTKATTGKPGAPTNLFNNYLKAFSLPITTPARELVEKHIMQYPVDGYVEEAFSEENAPLKFYKTEEERKVLASTMGLKAVNWLKNVRAIRG